MRVRGSKRRVHLSEVDLQPAEQKPMLRIAPAAASLIWLGSIVLATAIYMEWLPARALFQPAAPAPRARPPGRPVGEKPRLSTRSNGRESATPRVAAPIGIPPEESTPNTSAAAPVTGAEAAPPPDRVSTPAFVPESSRTIRGSYYSDDSNWAAGW